MAILTKADPLSDWDNMPESHARIGYENLISSADSDEATKATRPNTFERWTDASGVMEGVFSLGSASTVDFVGIAAHNLFTAGVTEIEISYATVVSGPYTVIEAITPTSNKAIMINFTSIDNVVEVKIAIPSDGSTDREIGVVYAGQALQMYQPIYGGHSPINLSGQTSYQNRISETGNFLDRREIRRGISSTYNWDNLDPNWYREKFEPFVESARSAPFFIKWRPDKYPNEVAYGFTTNDIQPSNTGGGIDLMSASFSMRGHDE